MCLRFRFNVGAFNHHSRGVCSTPALLLTELTPTPSQRNHNREDNVSESNSFYPQRVKNGWTVMGYNGDLWSGTPPINYPSFRKGAQTHNRKCLKRYMTNTSRDVESSCIIQNHFQAEKHPHMLKLILLKLNYCMFYFSILFHQSTQWFKTTCSSHVQYDISDEWYLSNTYWITSDLQEVTGEHLKTAAC